MERILAVCTIYGEQLSIFGVSNVVSWEKLGYSILLRCPLVLGTNIDVKKTQEDYSSINSGIDADFVSHFDCIRFLNVNLIYADIPGYYTEMGVPLSREYVCKEMNLLLPAEQILRPLPGNKTMINLTEYPQLTGMLLRTEHVIYRAICNYRVIEFQYSDLLECYREFTAEEGDIFMDLLKSHQVILKARAGKYPDNCPSAIQKALPLINYNPSNALAYAIFAILPMEISNYDEKAKLIGTSFNTKNTEQERDSIVISTISDKATVSANSKILQLENAPTTAAPTTAPPTTAPPTTADTTTTPTTTTPTTTTPTTTKGTRPQGVPVKKRKVESEKVKPGKTQQRKPSNIPSEEKKKGVNSAAKAPVISDEEEEGRIEEIEDEKGDDQPVEEVYSHPILGNSDDDEVSDEVSDDEEQEEKHVKFPKQDSSHGEQLPDVSEYGENPKYTERAKPPIGRRQYPDSRPVSGYAPPPPNRKGKIPSGFRGKITANFAPNQVAPNQVAPNQVSQDVRRGGLAPVHRRSTNRRIE